jgi:hypothetical protein
MYHATMPTDALVQVRAALFATRDFGFEKVREGARTCAHASCRNSPPRRGRASTVIAIEVKTKLTQSC